MSQAFLSVIFVLAGTIYHIAQGQS